MAEGTKTGLITPELHILEKHIKRNLSEINFLHLHEISRRDEMALDGKTSADSDEDDYIDQYGNDEAAMGGDNAHDFYQYNFLTEKLKSPLNFEENDEFQRFKLFLKGFELSEPEALMSVINNLDETDAKILQGLCRVRMVQIKPTVRIPRKILTIKRALPRTQANQSE